MSNQGPRGYRYHKVFGSYETAPIPTYFNKNLTEISVV